MTTSTPVGDPTSSAPSPDLPLGRNPGTSKPSTCFLFLKRQPPRVGAWVAHGWLFGYQISPPVSPAATRPFNYPTLTFEPCNSVFQTLFCPTTFFSRFLCLSSLISSRSKGVLWIIKPSSIPEQCFSWKGGPFRCNILFFWYFSDLQRLFQVRSASMTNMKPSRGFVCHYFHNAEHIRHNCRKLQNKNRRFQSVYY